MANAIPEPVTRLIDALSRLPSVGPKTASRMTYFLLRMPDNVSLELSEALRELKALTRLCSTCYNITVNDPCPICADSQRDHKTVLVVEEPMDVMAIERGGGYKGVYHVLHGAINPLEGVFAENLKIKELVARVDKGEILEIIIATNPSQEGDATAQYIKKDLASKGIKLTWL